MRVLLVEDDVSQHALVSALIGSSFESIKVVTAETLAEADTKIDGVDVVILDLGLPGSTHDDVFNWITQHRVPIVVYSSSNDDETIGRAIESGALNFICKGTPAEQLIVGLKVAIAEHRLVDCVRQRRAAVADIFRTTFQNWINEFETGKFTKSDPKLENHSEKLTKPALATD